MNLLCLVKNHKYGKMLFDENNNPYKLCIRCGKRQNYAPKSLAELDKMTMNEIVEMMGEDPVIEHIMQIAIPEPPVCATCKGKLQKVEPEITMNNSILMECVECKERCYK